MTEKQHPIQLLVKASDKASPVLTRLADKVNFLNQPVKKLGESWGALSKSLNLKGLGGALSGVGGAVKNVGSELLGFGARVAGVGLAAGVAFGAVARAAEHASSRLKDNAARVGLSVDEYASLEFAAKRAGVENETFAGALDHLNKNLGDMTVGKGGGALLNLLNQVSPALAKQMRAAKGTDQAMALLTDAFAKIQDPAKRATLATAAFGKSGMQLGSWLHAGRGKLQETQREFMRLVGSQEQSTKAAGEFGDATNNAEVALFGLRQATMGALFPALTKLTTALTDFLVKHRDGLVRFAERTGAAIEKWVASGGLERLADGLERFADGAGKVISFLGPMGTAFAGLALMAGPLIASLGSLGVAMVTLGVEAIPLLVAAGPALLSFGAALGTSLVAAAPFVLAAAGLALAGKAIYDNWDELGFLFQNLGETLAITWRDGLKPMLEGVKFLRFAIPGGPAAWEAGMALGDSLAGPQPGLARPNVDVSALGGVSRSETTVKVDFANAPRGTRVEAAAGNTESVDLSVGYAMAVP